MKDRLRDIVAREYGPLGHDHAQLREKLMASIPDAVPEPHRRRRNPVVRLLAADNARAITERILKMNRIPRIAAAIIIAAVAGTVAFLTLGDGGTSIAWADVQQRIRNARTMTLKATMEMEGLPKWMEKAGLTNMEMTMMFKSPGLMRQEMAMGPSKSITIMDIQQNKMIVLAEAQKRAIVIDLTELPAEARKKQGEQDFLGRIKKLIEESGTELGDKKIDGRAVKGYRVEKGKQVFTVWADAKTAQPVEVNMTMFQGETKMTMSDFRFDVELDDSLFSVEVPKGQGYTVSKEQMEIKEPSADDLVEMLRIWTQVRGGTFPDALTPGGFTKDTMSFVTAGKDGKLEKQKSVKEFFEKADGPTISLVITRAIVLIAQHGEARYAGKGVKLGDAKTAIFWYRPQDSETYKVIYGDLRIEDVAEDDLPQAPE